MLRFSCFSFESHCLFRPAGELYDLRNGSSFWLISIQPDFTELLTPLRTSLLSVFTTRVIIHIRAVGRNGWDSDITRDLHTSRWDQPRAEAETVIAFSSPSTYETEESDIELKAISIVDELGRS